MLTATCMAALAYGVTAAPRAELQLATGRALRAHRMSVGVHDVEIGVQGPSSFRLSVAAKGQAAQIQSTMVRLAADCMRDTWWHTTWPQFPDDPGGLRACSLQVDFSSTNAPFKLSHPNASAATLTAAFGSLTVDSATSSVRSCSCPAATYRTPLTPAAS